MRRRGCDRVAPIKRRHLIFPCIDRRIGHAAVSRLNPFEPPLSYPSTILPVKVAGRKIQPEEGLITAFRAGARVTTGCEISRKGDGTERGIADLFGQGQPARFVPQATSPSL